MSYFNSRNVSERNLSDALIEIEDELDQLNDIEQNESDNEIGSSYNFETDGEEFRENHQLSSSGLSGEASELEVSSDEDAGTYADSDPLAFVESIMQFNYPDSSNSSSSAAFKIINICNSPILFKVRTTNVIKYQLYPVFGVIDPQKLKIIQVYLNDEIENYFTIPVDKFEVRVMLFPEAKDKEELERFSLNSDKRTADTITSHRIYWNSLAESRREEIHRIDCEIDVGIKSGKNLEPKRSEELKTPNEAFSEEVVSEKSSALSLIQIFPEEDEEKKSQADNQSQGQGQVNRKESTDETVSKNSISEVQFDSNNIVDTVDTISIAETIYEGRRILNSFYETYVVSFVRHHVPEIVIFLLYFVFFLCILNLWVIFKKPRRIDNIITDFDDGIANIDGLESDD